jgi:ferredoxin
MAKFNIIYKKDVCIGCGACASTCPDNWEMEEGDDVKARVKSAEIEELGCNKEAEEVCPVDAIKVEEA